MVVMGNLAPISQQRGPWDSSRQNPGENTGGFFFVITYEYCWVQNNKVVVTVEFMLSMVSTVFHCRRS